MPGSILAAQNFGLDRHAEWDAEILEPGCGVNALGKLSHALGVEMGCRQNRPIFTHDLHHGGVHHAAGADHRRAIDGLAGQNAVETFSRGNVGHRLRSPMILLPGSGASFRHGQNVYERRGAGHPARWREHIDAALANEARGELGYRAGLALVQKEGADIAHHRDAGQGLPDLGRG